MPPEIVAMLVLVLLGAIGPFVARFRGDFEPHAEEPEPEPAIKGWSRVKRRIMTEWYHSWLPGRPWYLKIGFVLLALVVSACVLVFFGMPLCSMQRSGESTRRGAR